MWMIQKRKNNGTEFDRWHCIRKFSYNEIFCAIFVQRKLHNKNLVQFSPCFTRLSVPTLHSEDSPSSGKAAPGPDPGIRRRTQIGMFRPIRMDHTNCLQVAIKTFHFICVAFLTRSDMSGLTQEDVGRSYVTQFSSGQCTSSFSGNDI